MFHGTRDEIVPIEHAELMTEAMRDAGVPFEYYELKDSGHSPSTVRDQRTQIYATMAFLGKHLPNDMNPYGQSEAAVAVESAN